MGINLRITKVIIAPNAFKDSLSARAAAEAIAEGIFAVMPSLSITLLPVADGGTGTAEALIMALGGKHLSVDDVHDPLGRKIKSSFAVLADEKTAVIEMANASGLPLLSPAERNPLKTSTFGTGDLIRAALNLGFRNIIIGVGGSATNDAGIGAAQALGVKFFDSYGNLIRTPATGADLQNIADFDLSCADKRLQNSQIIVACDVNNPLTGKNGCARVYAPQKGATPEMVEILETGLISFASLIKNKLGKDLTNLPYGGAAGGLAAGLFAFFDAKLVPGADFILDMIKFDEKIAGASLVITGEGSLNRQTLFGKAPICVARRAKQKNIPVLFLTGAIEEEPEEIYQAGVTAIFSILDRLYSLKTALTLTAPLLTRTTRQIFQLLATFTENNPPPD